MEWDGKVVTFKKIKHTILTESTFNDVHPGTSLLLTVYKWFVCTELPWQGCDVLWWNLFFLYLERAFTLHHHHDAKQNNTEKPCFGDFCHSKSAMTAIMWDRDKRKEQMKMVTREHIQVTNPFTGFEVRVWLWANKSREWGWASLRHHLTETPDCIRPLRMCIFQLTLVGLTTDLKTCLKWALKWVYAASCVNYLIFTFHPLRVNSRYWENVYGGWLIWVRFLTS